MLSKFKLNQLYFKDTQFANLMTRRIFNVLLIANPYDAFMLEDDGRIDEKIFNEYTSLSLRYPPRFTQVSTCEEALTQLSSISFDLIICMPGTGDNDSFDVARYIKNLYEQIPMVILTPFSHGITKRIANEDLSPFEYVFCWLGNTDLLVSIIKLIEDKMNLEHDVNEVGVQLILLVEDGIRFYSSILPNLYKFVLKQSQEFSTEALNAHQRTLRMRGRPKIVLARTYEEAFGIYQKYKNNILGVITDVRFPRVERGEKDGLAGIKLCAAIRKEDPFVPLIIQSSESDNVAYAAKYDAAFIDKNSKKMDVDLRRIVSDNFGFGDFIFRNPDTLEEIARVKNLKELQNILFAVPAESFLYHISRNHVSRWLYSRAMFPVAEFLRPITWNSLQDVDAHRKIIFEAIVKYRKMKNQGVVAVFRRDRFDRYSNFARIGDGSLGGKGRGLAFIDNLVKHHPEFEEFENARVAIPKTIVLCTDVFDEFMDTNNLYQIALSDADDDVILRYFLKAKLPDRLVEDFFTFFDVVKSPLAIRSSSLLEDSHYQPFAGIYNTYMIPYLDDKYEMLRMLSDAIKGVYASVYFRDSKAYMQATSNVIDQEKMAVILQEVVGNQYGDRYYPQHVRRGTFAQLLPHRRREGRRRYRQSGTRLGQIYCGRRHDAPLLALSPQPGAANQRNGDCPQRDSDPLLCPRPAQCRSRLLHRRRLQPAETARQRSGKGRSTELHSLHLRPLRPDYPRRALSRRTQSHHLCQHPATRRIPPATHPATGFEIRRAGDAPSRRDRVCRHHEPREGQNRHLLPAANPPDSRHQGDAG